jgi:LPXTG-site transpeptidase (sortase) family protein
MNENTHYHTRRYFKLFSRWAGLFLILFVLIYNVFNAPALWKKLMYLLHPGSGLKNSVAYVAKITPTPALSQANTDDRNALDPASVVDDHLVVPKIAVDAPIVWDSSPEAILDDLHRGVAQFAGTAHPGQNGNIFISGHSSYYWWDKGQYKFVFALLDQLGNNDLIYLRDNGILYIYQVYDQVVVRPDNLAVLDSVGEPIVTLMTCTPVGTALNRLIVRARQISPDPKNTIQLPTKANDFNLLPAIR